MLPPILTTPPASDEIEISVFGPGKGECVVVHLGHSEWMIVDSCVRKRTRRPVAIEYLEGMGINFAEAIKIIVATHWHDDHVRGISKLFEAAPEARICFAAALRSDEFSALTGFRIVPSRFTSGVQELDRVRALIEKRSSRTTTAFHLLSAGKRFWLGRSHPVREIWSLSPSDEDTLHALKHFASYSQHGQASPAAARIPTLKPNDLSVVLQLETVVGGILLGGDIEHHRSYRNRGWHAVLDHDGRPRTISGLLKAAHHGSYNGDCPEIWEHMVADSAVCLVSPFECGSTSLPRPQDIERIKLRTSRAFLTSNRKVATAVRDQTADKIIRASTRSFVPHTVALGHLQARSEGGDWVVRGTGPAAQL